ncbi:hypothetical protein [Frigoribacterium sp. UYMn621]
MTTDIVGIAGHPHPYDEQRYDEQHYDEQPDREVSRQTNAQTAGVT